MQISALIRRWRLHTAHTVPPTQPLWWGSFGLFFVAQVCHADVIVLDPSGTGPYKTVEEAVNAALPGDIVQLTPGAYALPVSGLSLQGKPITLEGLGDKTSVVLDSGYGNVGLLLNSGEGPDTVVRNLTVTRALISGIQVVGASPTLEALVVSDNQGFTDTNGAGIQIVGGNPTLQDITLERNITFGDGAGIYLEDAQVELEQVVFRQNFAAGTGGALFSVRSELTLIDAIIEANETFYGGTVVAKDNSVLTSTRLKLLNNINGVSAGVEVLQSQWIASQVLAAGQEGYYSGAIYCVDGNLSLSNATLVENASYLQGGAYTGIRCNGTFSNVLFAFNRGGGAGALYVADSTPEEENSSAKTAPHVDPAPAESGLYAFAGCNFYENGSRPSYGVAEELIAQQLNLDPGFQWIEDSLSFRADRYELLPSSPMRNAGVVDPAFNDPDGSRSDIGFTGGPEASNEHTLDSDLDGIPDFYELWQGLNPQVNDAALDLDGDGVLNADEYGGGTWANEADSDGDTLSDSEERASFSNPRDAFSPQRIMTLPFGRFNTIQSAIDAAPRGATIRVSPGTWKGALNLLGKSIVVQSVEGPHNTILMPDDDLQGALIELIFGEDSNTVIEGFTLNNTVGLDTTAALYVFKSSPTLSQLHLDDFYSSGNGVLIFEKTQVSLLDLLIEDCAVQGYALLYGYQAHITVKDTTIRKNINSDGGIIMMEEGSLALENVLIEQNEAALSAGLGLFSTHAAVKNTRILNNLSLARGGAIYAEDATVELEDFELRGNEALQSGSAIASIAGIVRLTSGVIADHQTSGQGTLYLELGATLEAQNLLVVGNQALYGGAISATYSTVEGTNLTLDGNQASAAGGALDLIDSTARLSSSSITYHGASVGGDLRLDPTSSLTLSYCARFGNRSESALLEGATFVSTDEVSTQPGYVMHVDDLKSEGDDFHLIPSSPLRDAGDPSLAPDPDGSRADIGYYGGALADFDYYQDADLDGIADGYEQQNGLNIGQQDGAADPDGDGLNNQGEYEQGTQAQVADTDGDGLSDQVEAQNSSDPRNAFDPSGEVFVPDQFDSIQAAIDAAPSSGRIVVFSGIYEESLSTIGKNLWLEASGSAGSVILDGRGEFQLIRFIMGEGPSSGMDGFLLRDGFGTSGGCMQVSSAAPTLRNLRFQQCYAESSGGAISLYSSAQLTDISLLGNRTGANGLGGGISITGGAPTLTRVQVTGNSANNGGGIYLSGGTPQLENLLIQGNQATLGGGLMHVGAATSARVSQATVHANTATSGAGIFVSSGTLTLTNSLVTGNLGPLGAGLGARVDGQYLLSQVNVWSNHGANVAAEVEDLLEAPGYLSVDPRYIRFSDDAQWDNDDLHLRPDSPLKNAGEAGTLDQDGTAAELGYYGGTQADAIYYLDQDSDGLYDGWEQSYGLSTTQDSSLGDEEGDTVTNTQEFEHGLNPTQSDSDGDGILDAQELAQGSDGADFFSPHETIVATDFFDSLQDAINAARDGVTLLVPEGRYSELLDFRGKAVTVKALGNVYKTILHGEYQGSVVTFRSGEPRTARLEGFTLTGGVAQDGGGIRIFQASPTLERLYIYGNSAKNGGGGISVSYGGPLISNTVLWGNTAQDGAGLAGRASTLELIGATVTQNTASLSGGGVTCVDICSPTFRNNIVAFNTASVGGGVNLILPGVLVFEYNNLFGNLPDDYGAFPSQQGRKGNIGLDPLFLNRTPDPLAINLRLDPSSPSVDRGQDVEAWATLVDLDDLSRPLDGNLDGEAITDMGAYELERDADGDEFLPSEGDCDDSSASVYPFAPEVCSDGIDQDCDGLDTGCETVDNDGDGVTENQGDCDDSAFEINPSAEEYEDGVDNNCDGQIDEGFETPTATPTPDAGGCACTQSSSEEPRSMGWGAGLLSLLALASLRRRR